LFSNVGNSLGVGPSISKSSSSSSSSNEDEIVKDPCFEYFKRELKGRNYVRCNVCQNQEATTKAFRNSKRIPALCTLEVRHLKSEMHKKAIEAEKVSHFSSPEKVKKTQLGSMISKSNACLK
jgi:hypothetical protein